MTKRTLFCVIGILLVQFYIRAHNPTELPFFWDESRHITRAASIWEGIHPAKESNGKFLLYIWLAPFHAERPVALHVSRSAVALFSLLGTAGLYTLARRLFGVRAACVSIIFYSVVPFAVFFERMALADGLAGALGTLSAWQSVRLAARPTYQRAIAVGICASLAVMAKLTLTVSVVLMPISAALLFGSAQGLQGYIRRYWWYWFAAGVTFIVMWLPTLLPAFISGLQGEHYVLVDQTLVDETVLSSSDAGRFGDFQDQLRLLISAPMVIALLGIIVIGLWKLPRPTLYGLIWLLPIWIPLLVIVWRTQSRYFMPGVYPVALLVGSSTMLIKQKSFRYAIYGGFAVWILAFALPFAYRASSKVTVLEMPSWDTRDYYRAPWNSFALIDSLDYLNRHGEIALDGKVHVIGVSWMCAFMDLYTFNRTELTCIGKDYDGTVEGEMWQQAIHKATSQQPLYLMLEQHRKTLEIPKEPFAHPDVMWIPITQFQRPHNGLWVTVWEVRQTD